ncbi:MAG: class I SAM-dependent methyltransferase [Chloroflexota bacterium]
MTGDGERAGLRAERVKTDDEMAIERRWRDRLLAGATADDFRQAYDQLHAEFLSRQAAEGGAGEIYRQVNPRASGEDRVRAVALRLIGAGACVLEIGSGDGATAAALAGQGNRVVSVDVSTLALDTARARWCRPGLDLRFAFGDARSLPMPAASFDYVISENMVEHLSLGDMAAHLDEARRVLAPGGAYLIYTPTRLWSGRVSAGFHLHVYTLRELCALLRRHGFRPVWIEPRLLRRTGRLVAVGGLGLRVAWLWEVLLGALHVHRWPPAIKARILPSVLVCARKLADPAPAGELP